jgi:hypothetical protein
MGRTIEVTGISDELLSQLDKRANQIGVDRSSYLRRLIERAVAPPSSWSNLSELLAPVHDYTEAHGISEDETEQFFVEELAETRRKNQES